MLVRLSWSFENVFTDKPVSPFSSVKSSETFFRRVRDVVPKKIVTLQDEDEITFDNH
jgi:hypothetical protein